MPDFVAQYAQRSAPLRMGRLKFALALADGPEDDLELAASRLKELAARDPAIAAVLREVLLALFGAELTGAFHSDN
jgi:hypothetical protein